MKIGKSIKKDVAAKIFVNNSGNISKTCKILGIQKTTFRKWQKELEFNEQVNDWFKQRLIN